ncbi:hypothetical protein [Streptomyces carminius]|uniref:hypothetical protein n=1 Tax=Streptomyces carminius TaxID=2665496 RepID=UPI00130403E6|nr:hypothetical protein [Streptomyces carminius]
MTTIDELLADARVPATPATATGFDIGAARRRRAADAARATPAPDLARAPSA